MTDIEGENQPSADEHEQIEPESGDETLQSEDVFVETNNKTQEFLDRYGPSVSRYGTETSLSIEIIDPARKGKDQPDSWAIDLDKGVIYADPQFFIEHGYELADSQFALYHEVEHFREKRDLLNEPGGYQAWQRQKSKIGSKRRLHLIDNILDDIRMNRTVVGRAPSLEAARSHLYQEKLFPEFDFRSLPKHLQFAYSLLRERMLPGQMCQIDDSVRQEIDLLHQIKDRAGRSIIDVMTDPSLLPSQRLKLQESFFEPVYERLFQEDVADQRNQPSAEGGGSSEVSQAGASDSQGDQSSEPVDGQPAESLASPDGEGGENQESLTNQPSQPPVKPTPTNPEDIFKEYYDDFFANSPDAAIDHQAIDEILKKYAQDKGLDLPVEARNEAAYAKAEGVTVNDLRSYRRLWEQVSVLRDPETNEPVIDQLREIFRRVITERTNPRHVPYAPQSEGEVLINPVQAYADVLAGKEESEAWLTHHATDRPAERFGQFDVTLICDRSGSMQGQKGQDQLRSAVLLMEALKEFSDELDEVRVDLETDLQVRTEVRSFGAGDQRHDILKPLDSDLTERQRVATAKALRELPGSTPDFLSLEDILVSTSDDDWEQISAGRLRKIIITLSDGESDDSARTQQVLAQLREKGVAVAALGMGQEAGAIETTYAPDAQIVANTKELAATLAKVLEKFLAEL